MDNLLANQKNMIKNTFSSYVIRAILLLILLPLSYSPMSSAVTEYKTASYPNTMSLVLSFGVLVLLIIIAITFAINFAECIKAYRTLNKICTNDCETKEVTFDNISFLTVMRCRRSFSITGLILTDIYKNKYFYILTEEVFVSRWEKRAISEKLRNDLLNSSLQISCYEGTNIIQELKLDMYKHT